MKLYRLLFICISAIIIISCDSKEAVREFIGCKWDVSDLHEVSGEKYDFISDSYEPFFGVYFFDSADERELENFVLLDELTLENGLHVQVRESNDRLAMPGVPLYWISKEGFSEVVAVIGRTEYKDLILNCGESNSGQPL